ncbi:MAG TPA: hypothetical protein VFZ26_07000 [Gemmatimonadales bacterium]
MSRAAVRPLAGCLALGGLLACREPRAAVPAGADPSYDLTGAPTWQVDLPGDLHEISGLATAADGRLFAHGDEEAAVYQIDPRAGTVLKRFTLASTGSDPDLGKKSRDGRLAGDFEGIAIVEDRFFLVTSNGVLLEFKEGENGGTVRYEAYPTALSEICEVEGLAHDDRTASLLILCKTMRSKAEREQVAIYAWSLGERGLSPAPRLAVPWRELARVTGEEKFNGSALEVMPGDSSLLLLAGPQQLFAEITMEGVPVRGGRLDGNAQPQPEGIALLQDGSVLVASEGGKGDATIAGYAAK